MHIRSLHHLRLHIRRLIHVRFPRQRNAEPQVRLSLAVASMLLIVSAAQPWVRVSAAPTATTTLTVTAEADARVEKSYPNANYGTSSSLLTDSSPAMESYLRFTVRGVSGTVQSAKLRVYAFDGSTNGPAVYATGTTWTESGISWNNRPARIGSATDDKGTISKNAWTEYNVTPVVTGNATYSFVLVPTSSDGVDMYARESVYLPHIVVTLAGSTDTTAPDTTITSGPSGTVSSSTDSFSFSSTEPGSSFACSLDGAAYTACASPKEYSGLTNGVHTFSVRATDAAGNTDPTSATRSWTVSVSPDPVLIGAGDIADCASWGDEATAKLLDNIQGTVFTTGDHVYPDGTDAQFANCYQPTWGRHKARTKPSVGNHEYHVPGAAGYFNYFGAAAGDPTKGYYSYDLGGWHIIVLNTNCSEVGGCEVGSPQERWLRADLQNQANTCTLAYGHHPRFSSGSYPNNTSVQPLWQALYDHGADVVLAGHDHNYQRYAPQDPTGKLDLTYGIREFVVGTGGKSLYQIASPAANLEAYNTSANGLLKLTLHAGSYDWQFVPVEGKTYTDSGNTSCHGAPPSAGTNTQSTIYYIDSVNGDDANAGISETSAWKTVGKASQASLVPGDKLLFKRGGTWSGTLDVTESGMPDKPITIASYGTGDRPVIAGVSTCVKLAGSYLVLRELQVDNCSWSGVRIGGNYNWVENNLITHNVAGIYVPSGAMNNKVIGNELRDNNRMSVLTESPNNDDSGAFGILLHGDYTEIAYNTISGSDAFSYDYGRDGAAIEIYGAQNNHIHHNQATDNDAFSELGNARSSDNTYAYNVVRSSLSTSTFLVTRGANSGYGPVLRTRLYNNTVVLTGSSSQGFVCHAGCSSDILTMRNNIIQAVAKVGYADAPFDEDYNLFHGGPLQFAKGSHSLAANPVFVDQASGNLRLQSVSPAIDGGTNVGYSQDFDKLPIPVDGNGDNLATPDIGAFEYRR